MILLNNPLKSRAKDIAVLLNKRANAFLIAHGNEAKQPLTWKSVLDVMVRHYSESTYIGVEAKGVTFKQALPEYSRLFSAWAIRSPEIVAYVEANIVRCLLGAHFKLHDERFTKRLIADLNASLHSVKTLGTITQDISGVKNYNPLPLSELRQGIFYGDTMNNMLEDAIYLNKELWSSGVGSVWVSHTCDPRVIQHRLEQEGVSRDRIKIHNDGEFKIASDSVHWEAFSGTLIDRIEARTIKSNERECGWARELVCTLSSEWWIKGYYPAATALSLDPILSFAHNSNQPEYPNQGLLIEYVEKFFEYKGLSVPNKGGEPSSEHYLAWGSMVVYVIANYDELLASVADSGIDLINSPKNTHHIFYKPRVQDFICNVLKASEWVRDSNIENDRIVSGNLFNPVNNHPDYWFAPIFLEQVGYISCGMGVCGCSQRLVGLSKNFFLMDAEYYHNNELYELERASIRANTKTKILDIKDPDKGSMNEYLHAKWEIYEATPRLNWKSEIYQYCRYIHKL